MYVIEVIPLTLLPANIPQILSYFFDSELPRGAIVEISLNKRKVKAVVLSSSALEKEKLSLKRVDFQIKKLTKVLYKNPQVSNYQLKITVWLVKYYYAPLGYTLKTILPPFAFKKKYLLNPVDKVIHLPTSSRWQSHRGSSTESGQVGCPQLWIYRTKKLAKHLEPIIKRWASSKQILIVVSEKASISYFFEHFSKKYNTSVVFSGLSNEKLYNTWSQLTSHEGTTSQLGQVVIGTRQALNIPFSNLGLIIVDDPLNEFYKSDMIPRYNAVVLAHKVAELNNSQLILVSVVPGVENHYKSKTGTYELKEIEPRPKFNAEIVDMAQEVKNANWTPISKKLNEKLITCLRNNKKVLIFSPRRGYAGILICSNCGSAVKCPQCEVAMRTHRSVEMILACHHCGISKPVPTNCPTCESHSLKTVGPVGTQKIYEEIKRRLMTANIKSPVLVLDTDIVKNEAEEEEIISEISKSGASVLIATQMIFSHRFYLNFDLIGITNADVLINMPDFRSEENLFYQMEKLVNFEPNEVLIQTYNPENKITEKAARGDYVEFYENELKLRKALNYPPFYRLIKLTFRHKHKNKASYAARITTEKLKMVIARARLGEEIKIIEATPAYIERERNLYAYNIFLKVHENHKDINELLKYIGPRWIIDVEPRTLL